MLTSLLILSVIAVLIATPILLHFRRRQKRTAAMRRAADELGFSFSVTEPVEPLTVFASSYLFSQGSGKTLANIMRGTSEDLEVQVFDFSYVRGGEESRE